MIGMGIPWGRGGKEEGRGGGGEGEGTKPDLHIDVHTQTTSNRTPINSTSTLPAPQKHAQTHSHMPCSIQHTQTSIRSVNLPALTPSQSRVDVDPHSLVGSKHLDQKVVDHHGFTQHPGEDGQEQVVEEHSHKGARNLARRGRGRGWVKMV